MLRSLIPKRRILMTVDAVGGVWRYALDLAEGLTRSGHSVVLAGLGPRPSRVQVLEAERIATLEWLRTPLDWMIEDEGELDGLPGELSALCRDYGIDLMHLNAPSQAYGVEIRCPVVVVSHSCVVTWSRVLRAGALPPFWRWQIDRNRRGFERADRAVAPSAAHAALLERCYGPIAGMEAVHNAVRPQAARAARERFGFAAGRWWDEGKDGATLEKAAAYCCWPLSAAGSTEGPNGQSISFKAVNGLGELPGQEVRSLMAQAGIFVSPSIFEPFGLAALEAAEAGTPLVLADIPTYRELWDGAALFFPPRDADALASAFNAMAADEQLRRRLGEAARSRALRLSPERQLARMLAVYDAASAAAMAEA